MTVDTAVSETASAVLAKPGPASQPPPRRVWLLGSVLGLLLLGLFGQRLAELSANWKDDPNYSHGFLVPLVSVYLAYRIYQRQGAPKEDKIFVGMCSIVLGCLLHLAAVVIWWPPLDFLALTAILMGAAMAVGGWTWARGFVFPIFFLFFMFPLPVALVDRMALWLQDTVTGLATNALSLFIPTVRDGYSIHAAGQGPVEVGEACSGLRQMVAFAALAFILAHLVGRSVVYRLLLLLAAPLVAIVSNLLRVLLMCLIVRYWGDYWISGAYHDMWGLLTMLMGLGFYLGIAWWLAQVLPEPEAKSRGSRIADRGSKILPRSAIRALGSVAFVLALALAGQAALNAHLHNGQLAPPPELEPGTLSRVPVSLGAWIEAKHLTTLPPSSSPVPPETQEAVAKVLENLTRLPDSTQTYFDRADDKVYRAYLHLGEENRNPPLVVWLWMVHFRSGEDRNHHPSVCYKVAGKTEEVTQHGEVEVPGEKAKLQRFCFTGKTGRSYVYYWHYTLEPPAGQDLSVLQTLYLKRSQRLPSITVEVFTNALTPADLDQVADFCQQVHREMRARLPATSRLGSDLLNIRLVETGASPQG